LRTNAARFVVAIVAVAIAAMVAGANYMHLGPFGPSAAAQDWCAHNSVALIEAAEVAGSTIPPDLALARAELQTHSGSISALATVGSWENSHYREFAIACESAFAKSQRR
jgi:hypothetical protein